MTISRPTRAALLAASLGAAVLGLASRSAFADDRLLLRETTGNPYVLILLDTSGSMNWSTRCTQAQLDANECRSLCPDGDCFQALNGDDPGSKFYQAKEALFEAIRQIEDVNWGFATYNQDGLYVASKHWLYRATENGPNIPGWGSFPAIGSTDVFGRRWTCDSGANDNEIGCYPTNPDPADLGDAWERQRVSRLPKGGANFNETQVFYVRNAALQVYRIEYEPEGGALGDETIEVEIRAYRCNRIDSVTACDSLANRTFIAEVDVDFELEEEFISWDNGVDRTAPQNGYWPQTSGGGPYASDSITTNTCAGWDPNTDAAADPFSGYSIKHPTVAAPAPFAPLLNVGDVIPLSWQQDNKAQVLRRLAPNLLLGESDPDFSVSRYFRNRPIAAETYLRLQDNTVRPLVPNGSTPLGASLANIQTWFSGWRTLAAANDPDWACRKKHILILTDGDETCSGNPCGVAAALRALDVTTYVVAFGVENTAGNQLNCMATEMNVDTNGDGEDDTARPYYPQNRQELIDALLSIGGDFTAGSRTFASAAVPTAQAQVQDKLFLSSFNPINQSPVWDGHLNAFLRPLPLNDDDRPDTSRDCGGTLTTGCHLWDVSEVLLTQAPSLEDVAAGDLNLGTGVAERRVYYPRSRNLITNAVPQARSFLAEPADLAARQDLFDGIGLDYAIADLSEEPTLTECYTEVSGELPDTPSCRALRAVGFALAKKTSEIPVDTDNDGEPDDTANITHALGDIFHSNPTVIDRPNDFGAFAANLPEGNSTDIDVDCDTNKGYRCFAKKHEFRRKVLAVGANDGMIHFFDAGVYNSSTEKFGDGTGAEILAHVPRLTMPILQDMNEGRTQVFAVDGAPRLSDVYIDPSHSVGDPPTEGDREWRTILIGTLREGGLRATPGFSRVQLENSKPFTSGLFALDMTQPDKLTSDNFPINQDVVPTCLSAYAESECGPVPYGSTLWEFTDSVNGSPAEWGVALDEDANGFPDLGDSWSVPVVGRVRVLNSSGDLEKRWVAIFGGGNDPERPLATPLRGNWLYMVDVETGVTIYKQAVLGAIPANIAALDADNDNVLDVLYFGTTAGYLYKVALTTAQALVNDTATDLNGVSHTVSRISDAAGAPWQPFVVFDTLAGGVRRPLFFSPAILKISKINRFALAFGTGDRNNLWSLGGVEGRFYFLVDDNFAAGMTPKVETNYQVIDSEGADNPGQDFVNAPAAGRSRGWILTLEPNERVVAEAFSLAGITIFPTFNPVVQTVTEEDGTVCARTGDSRVFTLFSDNADGVLPPIGNPNGALDRSITVGDNLVTAPYVEQSTTKNLNEDGTGADTVPPQDANDKAWQDRIAKSIQERFFPPRARFGYKRWNISFIKSDTGIVGPIPIPVGVVIRNWKEF